MNNTIDFKGLRDPHLNVFWQYDGKPRLENNITKAFINTLDSLSESEFRIVSSSIFGINIRAGELKKKLYLQKKPNLEKVKKFEKNRRIMFAFNPDGKCWGFSGQDIKDERALYKAIKAELAKEYPDKDQLETETKKAVAEYLDSENGGSIPDGWIFIYVDNEPEYVIALENKLHKLDPNQLNNHIEKSLLIEKDKNPVVYRKYEEIIKCFEGLDLFLPNQFIEYLILLGYRKIDDFPLACSADKEVRRDLALNFGREILSRLNLEGNEIDQRKWNMPRRHVNYEYLKEVNLIFDEDSIRVSLAFGPTQNSGRAMIEKMGSLDLPSNHLKVCKQSFHLLYQRGKNIGSSYIDCPYSLNQYISYLRNNIGLIKMMTPKEAIALYGKLLRDGFLTKSNYETLYNQLANKKNKILVVPEIYTEYCWTYEELSKKRLDDFVFELNGEIREILAAARLIA